MGTKRDESLRWLPIDLGDVCIALSPEGAHDRWYIDLHTGETLLLNAEYDPQEHGGVTARQLESDEARFRRIPPAEAHQSVEDMSAYAESCRDETLKESLQLALQAPGPEKRFRSVLGWLPDALHGWHQFRQRKLEQRAKAYLASLGLGVTA
ncbi:MAG: UPF0158 family protein [Myxococcaceae bacterium]|nr:UPF0158 family protein [Myxococcaceae bacterium]